MLLCGIRIYWMKVQIWEGDPLGITRCPNSEENVNAEILWRFYLSVYHPLFKWRDEHSCGLCCGIFRNAISFFPAPIVPNWMGFVEAIVFRSWAFTNWARYSEQILTLNIECYLGSATAIAIMKFHVAPTGFCLLKIYVLELFHTTTSMDKIQFVYKVGK